MCLVKMDDLSGIVDDLRKKYCGLSGEVCYNERRQWALREYCRKENRMNQVNYQKELEKILNTLQEKGEAAPDYRPPRLFLHSCCAPCSSYCLEYLCRYFLITVFYYNPNISFSEEYQKRVAEQKRLIAAYNKEEKGWPIDIVEGAVSYTHLPCADIADRKYRLPWRHNTARPESVQNSPAADRYKIR